MNLEHIKSTEKGKIWEGRKQTWYKGDVLILRSNLTPGSSATWRIADTIVVQSFLFLSTISSVRLSGGKKGVTNGGQSQI